MTPERELLLQVRQRMVKKFDGMGAGLEIGAMPGTEFLGVMFYREITNEVFFKQSALVHGGGFITGIPNYSIPETARITWRDTDLLEGVNPKENAVHTGKILGEETIEIGAAVPQSVIDAARKIRGGLRLKIQMSNEGAYFGWDVAHKRDRPRSPDVYSEWGGNFCEAQRDENDKLRMGWYIHKKTGVRHPYEFTR
jgi:hypothetical protein